MTAAHAGTRPITVLIAALGGEGGGVLAEWLVEAATACDLPVQATSIPGVAQRTGATTYYLEIFPVPRARLDGREPVMSLTAQPGNVDVMVASELIEAARAMQNGHVSPDRTTLVASTHRIYATAEKMQMGDGRFDTARVIDAAGQLAKRAVLADLRQLAAESGTVINAVLFGAMAGAGALPLPRVACEQAIRGFGKGAEASLRGFAAGWDIAAGTPALPPAVPAVPRPAPAPSGRVAAEFPAEVRGFAALGVARCTDYQNPAYAARYLDRLKAVLEAERAAGGGAGGWQVTRVTARHLALWMCYEDVVRVADLKTRASRFERVRRETGAKPDEPVRVVDYLKPGIEEIASLLPPAPGRRLIAWAERSGRLRTLHFGMHVRTSSVPGWLLLRAVAWLRPWRPRSLRYAEEQARIERWLAAVRDACAHDPGLAREVAECARLVKGYGDTWRRGLDNFLAIMETLVEPPADDPHTRAEAVRRAREAALADPEGRALEQALGSAPAGRKPVIWLSRAA